MARAPEVFTLDPSADAAKTRPRVTIVETPDAFEAGAQAPPDTPRGGRGRFWSRLFWSALAGFALLVLTTAVTDFILDQISRVPALGYLALALAGLAALALVVLAGREVAALMRLGSAAKLRGAAEAAHAAGDMASARRFAAQIEAFYARDAQTARGRAALAGHRAEIIDGPNLILLAERELLRDKDGQARSAIAQAASRVAMVTTVSPRAWVDVGFVLAQSVMLITRIATIYSGRPGGLALWRLSARVATHLAITGGVAVATDAVSQFLGAGLASRISARLGEGMLNGVLTARVGLSALAVCRPMPFRALEAPALSDVAGSLLAGKTDAENSAG